MEAALVSTWTLWRNVQHVIDGTRQPQVVTNFQVHKHPTPDQMPKGALTLETNAFWRYQTLADRISEHDDLFTPYKLRANNACVNILKLFEETSADRAYGSIAANVQSRTLCHSLYDQQAGTAEVSFYLGAKIHAEGTRKWIQQRREQQSSQRNDLDLEAPNPQILTELRDRLTDRLEGATHADRRFILEALGITVIAQGNGSWELELATPKADQLGTPELKIANGRPGLGWGVIPFTSILSHKRRGSRPSK